MTTQHLLQHCMPSAGRSKKCSTAGINSPGKDLQCDIVGLCEGHGDGRLKKAVEEGEEEDVGVRGEDIWIILSQAKI